MPADDHLNFIEQIIENYIADPPQTAGADLLPIATRFPPEPNGYLHIGHAKSICLNFGLSKKYNGNFTLRFDDTNPSKEETEYVESIINDVQWLTGESMDGKIRYASDYFDQMYAWAEELINKGLAYVCDQTLDEMRDNRGTPDKPMTPSAGRSFSPEKNLELFRAMRDGKFQDGERTLRAKIDLASPNFNMRDPVMYRILKTPHHRQGDKWCIYPMYDWAHGLEDSIEHITHSICTLEFEHHRPLYDWFLDHLDGIWRPHQYEFARLNLTYTVMSKRKLLELVKSAPAACGGLNVSGWDDPRMPTICGFRRRGYTPEAVRNFCKEIGVAKFNSTVDVVKLENAVREDLNKTALRRMAVLNPVKLVIDNYPVSGGTCSGTEYLEAINNPENPADGTRKVPFSKVLYIEADDFMEDAPKKYYRLTPGQEVRLRYAYYVKCTGCVKDENGKVIEVHCTYDPATRGGQSPDGRKVQGTIHWVSAEHAVDAEVRLYDRLFTKESPDDPQDPADYKEYLNPNSLQIIENAKLEPAFSADDFNRRENLRYQFERIGYFCLDNSPRAAGTNKLVFNRTVSLRDSWAKVNR
ncbi:MAG: glutamine--tRNA ligase/YqeY domain fusion protein [Planctomycetaceae bacterium]|nr:glutamine--tRNA ligase/YqeY domain fusion protein [Planctomycetaceae bacterium]